MDVTNSSTIGGSLQISTDVIAKIAKLATLEIEGVKEVSTGTMGVKSLFNKVNLQKPILVQLTDDVAEIKALGRGVSGYDDHYWNGVRQVIIYEGLVAKFSQSEELKKRLLDTGNDMLAECAVKDRIWGIGLSMTDPDRQDMSKWKGQNLLGYALMMVRNKLIKTE